MWIPGSHQLSFSNRWSSGNEVFWVHFYFISCFPGDSCYNLSPSKKKILVCSPSCLYTDNQILVLELFVVVFAGIASLLEDEVGYCWVCRSTFVSYPALELHGKCYCRTGCRLCHSFFSSIHWRNLNKTPCTQVQVLKKPQNAGLGLDCIC